MQGPIDQIIFLTLTGNALARGKEIGNFLSEAAVFKFCRSVRFFDGDPGRPDHTLTEVAGDPLQWLKLCTISEGTRFRLAYEQSQRNDALNDRLSVSFVGGGGIWSAIVDGATPATGCWQPHWRMRDRRIGDHDDPDRRIWEVGYFRRPVSAIGLNEAVLSLDEAADALDKAFVDIGSFALSRKVDGFAASFERARHLLRSTASLNGSSRQEIDLYGVLPAAAARLLSAVQVAWVFGGMGSWNDLGLAGADDQLYETVSASLYQHLTEAIVVAVNQSAAD